MRANWDQADTSARHEASHEDAFATFVVDRGNETLDEGEAFPFISNWIGNLSSYGAPEKSVYGRYRSNYYERKSRNKEVGKVHHYPGASFRFSRGLVSPDLPGLETAPSFPDDWDVDSHEVLREPLIHDLSDRREVFDDNL